MVELKLENKNTRTAAYRKEGISKGIRICSSCKTLKPFKCFSAEKRSIWGIKSICKICLAKGKKVYREKHPEIEKKQRKIYKKRSAKELLDSYIKGILVKEIKEYYCVDDIRQIKNYEDLMPLEIIALKREELKLCRLLNK